MADMILTTAMMVIGVAFLLIMYRFMMGPSLVDRVIALDVLTVSSIGLLIILAWHFGRFIYIDVAIVYAILSFIGVIVIAKFLEKSL